MPRRLARLLKSISWPRLAAGLLWLASAAAVSGAWAQAPQVQAKVDGQTLAGKSGCFSCHGLVHTQVGPGFAQVAARYRDDAQAPARLAAKIRSGGVGAWGRLVMPRQLQVSESDAAVLAKWVLSQPQPRSSSTP